MSIDLFILFLQATARGLHEYPFLQEQSNVRPDAYGQFTQSHFHDLHLDGPRGRTAPFVHGDEPLPVTHSFRGHGSRVRLLPMQEQPAHLSSPQTSEHVLVEREPFGNRISSQAIGHPILGSEDAYMLSDGKIIPNDGELRIERKRKVFLFFENNLLYCFLILFSVMIIYIFYL